MVTLLGQNDEDGGAREREGVVHCAYCTQRFNSRGPRGSGFVENKEKGALGPIEIGSTRGCGGVEGYIAVFRRRQERLGVLLLVICFFLWFVRSTKKEGRLWFVRSTKIG